MYLFQACFETGCLLYHLNLLRNGNFKNANIVMSLITMIK